MSVYHPPMPEYIAGKIEVGDKLLMLPIPHKWVEKRVTVTEIQSAPEFVTIYILTDEEGKTHKCTYEAIKTYCVKR